MDKDRVRPLPMDKDKLPPMDKDKPPEPQPQKPPPTDKDKDQVKEEDQVKDKDQVKEVDQIKEVDQDRDKVRPHMDRDKQPPPPPQRPLHTANPTLTHIQQHRNAQQPLELRSKVENPRSSPNQDILLKLEKERVT